MSWHTSVFRQTLMRGARSGEVGQVAGRVPAQVLVSEDQGDDRRHATVLRWCCRLDHQTRAACAWRGLPKTELSSIRRSGPLAGKPVATFFFSLRVGGRANRLV